MNRDRFSVATFNLYNLQLPGVAMNPGQKRCREAMERVLAYPALNGKYDLLAEPANGRKIVCGARAQGPAARSAGLVERNDAQTPDVRVTTPHFSRPVLNFQVALRAAAADRSLRRAPEVEAP